MANRNRIHPLIAKRAMRAVRENPDDTAAAIRVIVALSGNSGRRHFRRFRRTARGMEILYEKGDLYALLTDRDRLKAMPPGSLGRTIIDWFDRENISTQGLTQASEAARGGVDPERDEDEQTYFSRLLNLHDVFHVLAGYDRDLRGESAVLAFTIAQNYNRGIAYLVWNALRAEGWNSPAGRLIREGYRRGRRAKPLVVQDWEELFERPIDEVREELGVGAPPVYEQLRSAGAPALSA
jgi:ubiquinone biosynthesis protein COQ4